MVPVGGTTAVGGQTIAVEVFLTANQDTNVEAGQSDVPCAVSALGGGVGTMTVTQLTTDPQGDGSREPSSAGIPYLFGASGLGSVSMTYCRIANAPSIGGTESVFVGADMTFYLGTVFYTVSDCAEGTFAIGFECEDQPALTCQNPPENTNTTKYIQDFPVGEPPPGPLYKLDLAGTTITVLPLQYGDIVPVGGNGYVDVGDVMSVLGGFEDPTAFPESDIAPCGGDGIIEMADILAILRAFADDFACPHPCP
jgi:hypothetical protein